MFVRIRWIFLRCSARVLYTRGILYTQTHRDRVWITIQGFTSCHESSWLSFWNFWHLPVTEKGETERSERQRGRVLARAGNPPATHLNCKWPERFSVPPSDRMKLFRETPLELASSSLRVSVCVRASSLLSSSLLSLVIRRSPPGSVRATEKFS